MYEGVWPQWEQYFWNNKNNYSYRSGQIAWENGNREYRFWGLDCSGYIGWMVHNSVHTGKSTGGYVTASTKIADSLVWMSGTVNCGNSSQASRLAKAFMQEYYPDWWSCFGKEGRQSVNASDYLYGTKFSWQNDGAVYDEQGFKGKTAEQVLDYIKVNW